jgi:hypothetical protein
MRPFLLRLFLKLICTEIRILVICYKEITHTLPSFSGLTKHVGVAVTLQVHNIRKLPGSNLDWDTDYPDRLVWFLSAPPGK